MKIVKCICCTVFMLSFMCSCTQSEFSETEISSSDEIKVSLNVLGAALTTRGISDSDPESTINNVYMLFYSEDALASDVAACTVSKTSLNKFGSWSEDLELKGLSSGVNYDVYVFANIPDRTVQQLTGITMNKAKGLAEQLTEIQNNTGSTISFSSVGQYRGGDKTFKIDVKRTVAKLQADIDMASLTGGDWALESVQVVDEPQKVSYFGTATSLSRVTSYNAFPVENSNSVYYYLYENPKSATADKSAMVKLKINIANTLGTKRSYTAIVNQKGSGEIKRNIKYLSKIILSEKVDPVEVILDTLAWDNRVNIDSDLPYTYIDFPTDVYTLSGSGFGDFYFNSNADSIYADWSGMQDLYINSEKGPKGYLKPENGSKGLYKISCTMAAVDGTEAKGTISLSAGNITRSVGMQRPAASYLLMFDVDPLDKYTEAYTFDYTNSTTAKINIKVRRTQGAMWYGIYCIGYDNEEGIYKPVGAYAFSPMALPDNFDFELSRVLNYVKRYKKVYFAIRLGCGFVASGGVGTAGSGTLIKTCYFNIQK